MATFRAMNTEVTVLVPGAEPAIEVEFASGVEHLFADVERIFSRFQPASELSKLNNAGRPTVVSLAMFAALQRARDYWEMTGGWFDPTIGQALCTAGYDRSFTPGALRARPKTLPQWLKPLAAPLAPILTKKFGRLRHVPKTGLSAELLDSPMGTVTRAQRGSFGDVRLDRNRRSVALPPGTLLDFGGFVKGRTVDLAVRLLPDEAAVDAGGDASLSGSGLDGRGWVVDVEDPFMPGRVLLTLRLQDRAVATSGPSRRKWRMGNRVAHHLIDPHTGEPARTDLAQVTVVARSAELADVLAKTAFLRGYADGTAFLAAFPSVGAVFVLVDGRVRLHGNLELDEHV